MTKYKIKILSIEFCTELNKSKQDIKQLEKQLQILNQNPDTSLFSDEIDYLNRKISEYYSNITEAARIRSKCQYIEDNEKSSEFFLRQENKNAKNKLWSRIKDENGNMLSGIDNILNVQKKFYEKLFASEGINSQSAEELLSSVEARLSPDESKHLDDFLTLEDLTKTVFNFKPGKSPGLDGLTAEFYQTFWYLIKHDYHEVVLEMLGENQLCDSQYEGILTLLYKTGERELLKNWRPLKLNNVDYKIVAGSLSNKIKPILPSIIHSDQKGYIKGRNINESNRLIQDLIDYTEIEEKEGIIIFLDQTKAFDRVEWDWVKLCLKKFGFGDRFINWISMLLNSRITIKTNGFFSDFFTVSRSIKQGCPVAPLIYLIQAEPMACKIRNNSNIQGIKLPSVDGIIIETKLSQFVDDTQFFIQSEISLPFLFLI